MKVIDASVWVSRLVPQDVHHAVSRRWLEEQIIAGQSMVAPVLLLIEVAGAIARRTGRSHLAHKATKQLLGIPALRLIMLDQELGIKAAQVAAERHLRGADALYVAVAYRLGIPLITWDQEQINRVTGFVKAFTPYGDNK